MTARHDESGGLPDHDYLWDGSGDIDGEIAELEGLLRPLGHAAEESAVDSTGDLPVLRIAPRRSGSGKTASWTRLLFAAAVFGAVVLWWRRSPTESTPVREPDATAVTASSRNRTPNQTQWTAPSTDENAWTFLRFEAQQSPLSASPSLLRVGETLDTGARRARLEVPEIGNVVISENSQVTLVTTGANQHRLRLDRGTISAKIDAPPRLFVVETPSVVAFDLGCEYVLSVGQPSDSSDQSDAVCDGPPGGWLHVTKGWVALAGASHEVLVPAGAYCAIEPIGAIGTPIFDGAHAELRRVLTDIDATGDTKELPLLLAKARKQDTLSLLHLLWDLSPQDRAPVIRRMVELGGPPPSGLSESSLVAGNGKAIEKWRETLQEQWVDAE